MYIEEVGKPFHLQGRDEDEDEILNICMLLRLLSEEDGGPP